MPKTKGFLIILGLAIISVISFFIAGSALALLVCNSDSCGPGDACIETPPCGAADPDCGVCTDSLTEFTTGSTATINLPAGGCSSKAKIVLPMSSETWGSRICNTSLDINYTGPATALTPYIWVPLSTRSRLVQINTTNGDFVTMYGAEDGTITCAAGTYCIWDCTANCGTNSPTWTERGQDTDCAFNDPSRITVIAGSQVWVANRSGSSVTQLTANSDGDYQCQGTYTASSGARGVTFDNQGNIWAGGTGDNNIYKFKSDGTSLFNKNIGYTTYGMIADSAGYVWISTGARHVVAINTANCTVASCPIAYSELNLAAPGKMTYGIGIDNEGDIWIGEWENNKIHEIDGLDADGGPVGDVVTTCSAGLAGCCTGIAVDKNNNVWFNGHNSENTYMIEGGDCANLHSFANVCDQGAINRSYPHGVAIDADNHAWVVCRQGIVRELEFNGTNIVSLKYIDLNAAVNSGTGNSASYNYSDMTGLRTPSLSVTVGGTTFPISNTLSNFGCDLEDTLRTCDCEGCQIVSCDKKEWWGLDCCEVPIKVCTVFSGGEYTLSNLNIEYTATPPSFLGGLVPCNRHVDDPTTNLDETKSCTLCHTFVLTKKIVDYSLLYLFIPLVTIGLVAAGVTFIAAAGNPGQIKSAKEILMITLRGTILILAAWLIIETIIVVAVPASRPWKHWADLTCPVPPCNNNKTCETAIGEDAQNCPTDCPCDFNDICDPVREQIGGGNPQSCQDCAHCGNGIKDVDEECDGADFGSILNQKIIDAGARNCNIIGNYSSGTFNCTVECRLDKTGCVR